METQPSASIFVPCLKLAPRWPATLCSMDEDGLYDYVIVNDELDKAFEELTLIAERALAGEIGAAPEHMQVLSTAAC